MSERLQVVVVTIAVFAAGLLAGIWTQRMRPMPPPPLSPMGEFGPPGFGPGGFAPAPPPPRWMLGFGHGPPISPRQMRARIEALQPQIEAFRKSVAAIESDFRGKLNAMLSADRKHKLDELRQSMPPPPLGPMPGCAGEAGNPFIPMVIYRPVLERLGEELMLDEKQREQLKTLLIERRKRLLELVDRTPPPSFSLGRMLVEGGGEGPGPAP
jgi:hypothetical protein